MVEDLPFDVLSCLITDKTSDDNIGVSHIHTYRELF